MVVKRTPLYDQHVAAKARLIEFAGWEMPVQYAGIQAEHRAVRASAGLFDVSHMGELEIRGADAIASANRVVTNDLTTLVDGQACYTLMCTPQGGIVDDLVVYRLSQSHVLVCCNSANREKDFAWMAGHIEGAEVVNASDDYAQLAIQGPKALEILQPLVKTPLEGIGRYGFVREDVQGAPAIVSRTGYTGEDGFEIYLPPQAAPGLWGALLEQGGEALGPVGLGARDTLRLEMKYALYGNDIDETTTPLEAGLGWVAKLKKPTFIGRDALIRQKAAGVPRRLVGFKMQGRSIARHGYPIVTESGEQIGRVTSGTRSPTLGENIGMGYVPWDQRKSHTPIHIRIRNRIEAARVVKAFISR